MHRKALSFLYFVAALAILAGALMATNWLPTVLQDGLMKKYGSIEEVKAKLNTRDICVPSYFPQAVKWPPSRILAQSRPYFGLVMEFTSGAAEPSLVISQVTAGGSAPEERLVMKQIKERTSAPLKGRNAMLEVGTCRSGLPCSRISWDEGKYRLTLTMKGAPFELMKIADSMVR